MFEAGFTKPQKSTSAERDVVGTMWKMASEQRTERISKIPCDGNIYEEMKCVRLRQVRLLQRESLMGLAEVRFVRNG